MTESDESAIVPLRIAVAEIRRDIETARMERETLRREQEERERRLERRIAEQIHPLVESLAGLRETLHDLPAKLATSEQLQVAVKATDERLRPMERVYRGLIAAVGLALLAAVLHEIGWKQ